MKYEHYDLIVVGTGFASTFFLKQYLAKVREKKRILVLEKGYFYPHQERLKAERGEQTPDTKYVSPWQDQIINLNKKKIWQFSTAYGGSSNCWWGCTPRFMPNDFQMKSKYGIEQDWPVNYDDLDPYYEQAEEIMSVSGPEQTPFPRKRSYPLPPHAFSLVDKIMHQQYGSLYVSQATARASRNLAHRNACLAMSTCHTCPVNAKFTIENSNLDVYTNEQVELLYGCQVYALHTAGGIVRSVCFHYQGRDHEVKGEVVALGANPFFNANILLNSGDNNPLTGRGIGEQLGMQVQIYLEDMTNVGGSSWVNANGYMLYDGDHRKELAACLIEVNNAPYYIRVERGKHLNVASFRMIFEDLPINSNKVTVSANRMKPEIHFEKRSEYALRGIEQMKKKLPGLLSCLPVEKIIYQDTEPNEGHILGGTRMSTGKADGVVDKHLIHHDYRNLFVLGAGAFTTFGPSNPTLTLSALSLYAADKMF